MTVLLPLFDEADCLPQLATAMAALDYPKDKLDIKLVLEERDAATRAEAARLGLADKFDVIVVPASAPQTKPKACNFALAFARGDLVVIYDAEDQPAPDQLRKAAAAFAAGPPTLACVQARLNYYNADENWLTRLFSLEYALWFDSLLPALQKLRAPIPLGGTSNILRTDVLTAIGGWDPYNVTEDADLGLRMAASGVRDRRTDLTQQRLRKRTADVAPLAQAAFSVDKGVFADLDRPLAGAVRFFRPWRLAGRPLLALIPGRHGV